MKDILIVLKPRINGSREPYNKVKMEAKKYEESVQEILGTAFLVTGPKSFEIAMSLYRIALENDIPVAFFEIESCLLIPKILD